MSGKAHCEGLLKELLNLYQCLCLKASKKPAAKLRSVCALKIAYGYKKSFLTSQEASQEQTEKRHIEKRMTRKSKRGQNNQQNQRTVHENREMLIVICPHCEDPVEISYINCGVFRHGVVKNTRGGAGKQIPPHASRETCEQLIAEDKIFGCGKPFRIEDKTTAVCCDYEYKPPRRNRNQNSNDTNKSTDCSGNGGHGNGQSSGENVEQHSTEHKQMVESREADNTMFQEA